MKIGYVGGFWATNIGNSFYDIGALYLLRNMVGMKNVHFIPDIAKCFWRVNDNYEPLLNTDLDLFIFAGPFFNKGIVDYKNIFDKIKSKNKKKAFLSVGASNYTVYERDFVISFLNNYKKNILFISTRDKETFDLYNQPDIAMFDGLCASMFLNDAVIPTILDDKYAVYSFNFFSEPHIEMCGGCVSVKKRNFPFKFQDIFENLKIIRTNHSAFSRLKLLLFNRPNTYYSDIPYGYLSIYKSAEYVFSDRVHACAASLIFGSKAMYIKGTKRSNDGRNNLFKRIGVDSVYEKPTKLNFQYIEVEKKLMINFIKKRIEEYL